MSKYTDVVVDHMAKHEELDRPLDVFVHYWGLDAYDPPEETMSVVRDLVRGALADAVTRREGEVSHGE